MFTQSCMCMFITFIYTIISSAVWHHSDVNRILYMHWPISTQHNATKHGHNATQHNWIMWLDTFYEPTKLPLLYHLKCETTRRKKLTNDNKVHIHSSYNLCIYWCKSIWPSLHLLRYLISARVNSSSSLLMSSPYYYNGNCQDTEVREERRHSFKAILSDPVRFPPFFCLANSHCKSENVAIFCGETDGS
jgi:hypothetical protein